MSNWTDKKRGESGNRGNLGSHVNSMSFSRRTQEELGGLFQTSKKRKFPDGDIKVSAFGNYEKVRFNPVTKEEEKIDYKDLFVFYIKDGDTYIAALNIALKKTWFKKASTCNIDSFSDRVFSHCKEFYYNVSGIRRRLYFIATNINFTAGTFFGGASFVAKTTTGFEYNWDVNQRYYYIYDPTTGIFHKMFSSPQGTHRLFKAQFEFQPNNDRACNCNMSEDYIYCDSNIANKRRTFKYQMISNNEYELSIISEESGYGTFINRNGGLVSNPAGYWTYYTYSPDNYYDRFYATSSEVVSGSSPPGAGSRITTADSVPASIMTDVWDGARYYDIYGDIDPPYPSPYGWKYLYYNLDEDHQSYCHDIVLQRTLYNDYTSYYYNKAIIDRTAYQDGYYSSYGAYVLTGSGSTNNDSNDSLPWKITGPYHGEYLVNSGFSPLCANHIQTEKFLVHLMINRTYDLSSPYTGSMDSLPNTNYINKDGNDYTSIVEDSLGVSKENILGLIYAPNTQIPVHLI